MAWEFESWSIIPTRTNYAVQTCVEVDVSGHDLLSVASAWRGHLEGADPQDSESQSQRQSVAHAPPFGWNGDG